MTTDYARTLEPYAAELAGSVEEQTPLRHWPGLATPAYHGLAGAFVALVEPASEADPVALLLQFLVAFGNAMNRGLYFRVEAAQHCGNLFVAIVGQTSKGRKGTSWDQVARLMRLADEGWYSERVAQGLSSGEGLLFHVRDPITKTQPIKDKQRVIEYQEVVEDPGVLDKRLLVVETEFAKVLRAMKRESSTLSATVRQAWDSDRLRVLTKNSPLKSTGAHISIVAHVTADELRAELEHTEVANGFLNRFLLACVRRSKCLPEGGDVPWSALQQLARRVGAALDFGRRAGEIERAPAARERWRAVYPQLSEGKAGLLGAVVSRAEAQVTRLSCLYAALDESRAVQLVHLEAALALWRYCEDSARYIFGDSLGDPRTDKLIEALREANPEELTRTQISRQAFGGNVSKGELDRAFQRALELGLASVRKESTAGRSREFWSFRSSTSFGSSPTKVKSAGEDAPPIYEIDEIRGTDGFVGSKHLSLVDYELNEVDELNELDEAPHGPITDDGGAWEPPEAPPEEPAA